MPPKGRPIRYLKKTPWKSAGRHSRAASRQGRSRNLLQRALRSRSGSSKRGPLRGGYNYPKAGSGFTFRGQARKPYILKKYGGQPRITKQLLNQLYGDNVVALSYCDKVATANTTGSAANQAMWGNRIDTGGTLSSTRVTCFNLLVHDPNVLQMYQTSGSKTAKLMVKSYKVKAILTNLENGPIEVWEYRLIARTRCSISAWDTVLSTIANPDASGSAAATNATNPAGMTVPSSTATAIQVGTTPYHFGALTKFFKISSVKKKLMNPADRWEIEYSCNKPMIFDQEKFSIATAPSLSGAAQTGGLWEGMGFSLFVMKGTFAVDSAGAATQKFGLGNATVGIEYQTHFHYAQLNTNSMSAQVIRDIPGFSRDEAGYMAAVVRNVNLNAISTGAVPAAAGSNQWGPSGMAVEDDAVSDED